MSTESVILSILLGVGAIIALICSIGMMLARDALQRLHYSGAVVALTGPLVAAAVWVHEKPVEPRVKVLLTVGLLIFTNIVLSHATARAIRIRRKGKWSIEPAERDAMLAPDPGDRTGANR